MAKYQQRRQNFQIGQTEISTPFANFSRGIVSTFMQQYVCKEKNNWGR
jgi:hypothetical protein